MFLRNRKAQGLLEYTLLLGAIVAIVVVVLLKQGGVASTAKDTYIASGNAISNTLNQANNDIGVFNGLTP